MLALGRSKGSNRNRLRNFWGKIYEEKSFLLFISFWSQKISSYESLQNSNAGLHKIPTIVWCAHSRTSSAIWKWGRRGQIFLGGHPGGWFLKTFFFSKKGFHILWFFYPFKKWVGHGPPVNEVPGCTAWKWHLIYFRRKYLLTYYHFGTNEYIVKSKRVNIIYLI